MVLQIKYKTIIGNQFQQFFEEIYFLSFVIFYIVAEIFDYIDL